MYLVWKHSKNVLGVRFSTHGPWLWPHRADGLNISCSKGNSITKTNWSRGFRVAYPLENKRKVNKYTQRIFHSQLDFSGLVKCETVERIQKHCREIRYRNHCDTFIQHPVYSGSYFSPKKGENYLHWNYVNSYSK